MNYTIQLTDKELDQIVGDLYYYFRHLKFNLDHSIELGNLDEETKEYLTNQLNNVLQLQSRLEDIRNKVDESNPLYILREVEINE